MELPDADSVVPTELQCDIQPGALRQRYSVQWRQILNDSYVFIADERMFNLTLNVNSSQNRSKYQCGVTIDHDGSNIRSYEGVLITIVTRSGGMHNIILLWTIHNNIIYLMTEVVCLSSAHLQIPIMLLLK